MDRLFTSRLVEAAASIRTGGLILDEQYSQTHSSVHEWLAKMNDAGLLTFDSQSGDYTTERAYVSGIMPVDAARAFSERVNVTTDYISMVIHGVDPRTPWETVAVTRKEGKRSGDWVSFTRFPLYMDRDSYAFEVRNALRLNKRSATCIDRYAIVECIDPKWGRFATTGKRGTTGLYPSVVRALTEK